MEHDQQLLLLSAEGYHELGMQPEAYEAIESIEPHRRLMPEVLVVRLRIYKANGKWKQMQVVTAFLCSIQPDNVEWWIANAFATSHVESLRAAISILKTAIPLFPVIPGLENHDIAALYFDLSVYHARNGSIEEAREALTAGLNLHSGFRDRAAAHPDLVAVWE